MGPYTMIRKLKRHGVAESQVEAALGEVAPDEVREVFAADVPLRRALAECAISERSDRRRYYAYLVLAAAPAAQLAARIGAGGYLERRRGAVERDVRRARRSGVSDEQLADAVAAIGARPVAEALAAPDPFGAWARDRARAAARGRERVAYSRLAACEVRRVRAGLAHVLRDREGSDGGDGLGGGGVDVVRDSDTLVSQSEAA